MAIENIAVNFGFTTAAVSGKTINNLTGNLTAGLLDSDLSGYDTGGSTGISLTIASSRTADGGGRVAGSTSLIQQINDDVAYHTGSGPITDVFGMPASVTSCTVIVHLCTTYPNQIDIDVTVNGSTQTGFDSTNNATGAVLTFTGVAPDGSDNVNITITNNSGSFIAVNGYQVNDIVEGGGGGGSTELMTLLGVG